MAGVAIGVLVPDVGHIDVSLIFHADDGNTAREPLTEVSVLLGHVPDTSLALGSPHPLVKRLRGQPELPGSSGDAEIRVAQERIERSPGFGSVLVRLLDPVGKPVKLSPLLRSES